MAIPTFGLFAVFVTKIGTVEVDVSPNQSHRFPTKITDNPVEDGSVFADHVVLLPVTLEIEGRITDASVTLSDAITGRGTAKDAWRELVRLQQQREPFDVVTGLELYQNMLIEELIALRTATDGQSVRFVAVLREVQIVGRNTPTNRQRVAESVRHTALPFRALGIIAKVLIS